MRILAIVLVLAAAVGGALYALGVFEPEPAGPGAAEGGHRPGAATTDGAGRLVGPPPETQPPLEDPRFTKPVRVLLVAGTPQRFNAWLAQLWGLDPQVTLRSWAPPAEASTGDGQVPGGDVLLGFDATPPRPTEIAGVDVLAIHDMDPSLLEDAFWERVAVAVRAGELGLLAMPGVLHGREMLDHPILGPLLPVARVASLQTQPIPGTFGREEPFLVTAAGARHPATRLVPWPTWSETIWTDTRKGDVPWGTRFVYPVEEVAEGARILVDVDPSRGEDIAAIVASAPDAGRVLWVGAWDLGSRLAYGHPEVVAQWRVLALGWTGWLAGQLTESTGE